MKTLPVLYIKEGLTSPQVPIAFLQNRAFFPQVWQIQSLIGEIQDEMRQETNPFSASKPSSSVWRNLTRMLQDKYLLSNQLVGFSPPPRIYFVTSL